MILHLKEIIGPTMKFRVDPHQQFEILHDELRNVYYLNDGVLYLTSYLYNPSDTSEECIKEELLKLIGEEVERNWFKYVCKNYDHTQKELIWYQDRLRKVLVPIE